MTRPIYEPSLQRTDARLGYGQSQLFRRPAEPAGAGTPIEWVYLSSTTNWAAAPTDLNWSVAGGSFDSGPPTFDLNASDNLEINKEGDYTFDVFVIQVDNDGSGTVWTHVDINFSKLAGPNASGPHGWVTGGPYSWLKTTYWPGQPLSGNEGDPHLHTFANWDTGDFVGTPFELGVTAEKFWDGVSTADTVVVVRLLAVRLGDPFV